MSSLQSIYGFNLDSDLVQKFLKDYTILPKNGKNIILCWIPSHVGIFGNEKSDAAAKSALYLTSGRKYGIAAVEINYMLLDLL